MTADLRSKAGPASGAEPSFVPDPSPMNRITLLAALAAALPAAAQPFYTYTLPTEFTALNNTVQFALPGPLTTGAGTLTLQWAACHSAGFSGSSIFLEVSTSTGWVTLLDENDNFQSCSFITETVQIPAAVLADALETGFGSLQLRMDCDDSCSPGVGCSFLSDPVVRNITISYTVRSAAFGASSASICPGATVTYNDASINNPTAFAWEFPGGVPATSTLQNPTVQYAAPGTYASTLIVQTTIGPDTLTVANAVTVQQPPPAFAGVDVVVCEGDGAQLQATGGTTYAWFPTTYLDFPEAADPYATPLATTTYTVLVTDANGCQASDAVTVSVQPLPTPVVDAGNNILCFGDTITLVAQGADLYSWSPPFFLSATTGSTVLTWAEFDYTYTVVGTDLFGCVGTTSVFIDVVTPPLTPTVFVNGAQLSTTAAAGYQWLLNGEPIAGATQATYTPMVNGNYAVTITDDNGCSATSATLYYGSVGVEALARTALRVHPQPAHDRLVVDGLLPGTELRIVDAVGRTVLHATRGAEGQRVVDVNAWTPGTYVLEARDAQGTVRLPIVVE